MGFLKIKQVDIPNYNDIKFECVDKADAAGCLLFNEDYTKILLVKQFRVGSEGETLEIPAGVVEENSIPKTTIKREIREETGYCDESILDLIYLGNFYTSPGYTSEKIWLYSARIKNDAIRNELQLDKHESVSCIWCDVSDLYNNNIIIDMKTRLAISLFKDKIKKKKIGIYGGTFNPITYLHLLTMERAIEEFNLDEVLIVPVNDKYNKDEAIDSRHRVKMINLGIENNDKIKLGDYEINQFIQPKTIQTLNYYQKQLGYVDIHFICGSDVLKDMSRWIQHDKILENYNIICVQRNDDKVYQDVILKDKVLVKYKDKINIIYENVSNDVSSSAVRNLVANNMSIRYLVPDKVREYIFNNKLYMESNKL